MENQSKPELNVSKIESKSKNSIPVKISNKSVEVQTAFSEIGVEAKQFSEEALPKSGLNSREEFHSVSLVASPEFVNSPKIFASFVKNEKSRREMISNSAIITQKYVPHKEIVSKEPRRKTYYRTTGLFHVSLAFENRLNNFFFPVEHNRQGIYKVKCPNCKKKKYPVIFCHKETVNLNFLNFFSRLTTHFNRSQQVLLLQIIYSNVGLRVSFRRCFLRQ